jgi:hypothetical protein
MKSVKQQYIDLQEGKMSQTQFMRNIRLTLPQYVTNVTSFDDSVRILKNKGILSEADIKSSEGEGKWKTVTGKDLYSHFKEIDNLNGQEVLTGIDYEMQKNCDLSKLEAQKIVIKNLKKNQFYYTSQNMSGVEGYEMEYMSKSSKPEDWQMKSLGKDNLVDKAMGMKPVKGFENAKASSNKASKETNKSGEIDIMSLVAKTVRGLVKMDATGEKAKKIVMKESHFDDMGEQNAAAKHAMMFIVSNPALRQMSDNITLQNDGENAILTYGQGEVLPEEAFNKLELQFNVEELNNSYVLTPKYKVQHSGVGLQSPLEEEIRKQVKEMFDGRDNLTDIENF